MTDADWQVDPPASVSVDGPRVAQERAELPEVLEPQAHGWVMAPNAPVWSWLPAVFPRTHRTWVHDRSTAYCLEWVDGVPQPRRALPALDVEDVQRLSTRSAELCGFHGWDATRVRFLRGADQVSVDQIVERIARAARRSFGGVEPRPELAQIAAGVVERALRLGR